MSAKTYNELRAQLKRWTRRTDIDDVFDTMIELVENEIYTGDRPLRVRELIKNANTACTIDDRTIALPTDYTQFIKVQIVIGTSTYDLDFISYSDMPATVYSGVPCRFTITDEIILDALPDSAYTINLSYFYRPPKLTQDNDTNTILQNYPNLYFFGLQAAIFDFAGEPELAEIKKNQFNADIDGANYQFKMSNFGPNLRFAGRGFGNGIRLPPTMRAR